MQAKSHIYDKAFFSGTCLCRDDYGGMHYANNFLTIAPRHIMAVAGQSKAYQQRLADAGVTVEWVPLESLIDGYGAAHCMTQVLKRY